jgi:ubiquinone/menaquinone biosynthesis C-methylase UbiE
MKKDNWYHVGDSAAEAYERNMVRGVFAAWAKFLVGAAAIEPGETILDIACGTGIVARHAAASTGPGGAVTGLEMNPAMLDVARRLSPAGGATMSWVEADATDMPLPDDAFDVALCQQGVQFFKQREAALAGMRRVLKPGGRLLFTVWRPLRHAIGHDAVAEAVEKHVGEAAAESRRGPFRMENREQLRELLTGAGFADVAVNIAAVLVRFDSARDLVESMMQGTPLAPHMQDAGPETVAKVIEMVEARTADHLDDSGLAFPMQSWLATGRAPG